MLRVSSTTIITLLENVSSTRCTNQTLWNLFGEDEYLIGVYCLHDLVGVAGWGPAYHRRPSTHGCVKARAHRPTSRTEC